MCVAAPGRVVSVSDGRGPMRPGLVELADGDVQEIDLAMVPDAGVGDYVITHSGFAVRRVDEEAAMAAYRLLGGRS